MRKCYVARSEMAVLFTCDSDDPLDLQDAAKKALRDEHAMNDPDVFYHLAGGLPSGWDGSCFVYGDHEGDLLAAEALKLNAGKEKP